MIWFKAVNLEELNRWHDNSLQRLLEITFTEIGDDFLKAEMPVKDHHKQPHGLLHGGANVTLAESLGSVASVLCINPETHTCVGLEINANHIRSVRSGKVYGITKPLHIGRSTQVWEIKIFDEQHRLTCVSRITNAVLEKKK